MKEATNETPAGAEILVADDTPESLKLLTELLVSAGYDVRPTTQPEVALASALQAPPDLALLDVRMPGMDGFELCRRLKEDKRTASVPVIFISALRDEAHRLHGFDAGGVDFITKPFEERIVLARVATHVRLARTQRELETERSLLEQKVGERTAEVVASTKRLQMAIEAGRVGTWEWDLRSNEFHASPEWRRQLGIGDDEIPDLNAEWGSRLHPDDRQQARQAFNDWLEGRSPVYANEFRLRHEDGFYRRIYSRGEKELDENGKPIRVCGCHVDLTEIRRMQAERERILTLSQDLICIADMDGYFKYLNPAWEEVTGYTLAELMGRPFKDFLHPEDRARTDAEVAKLAAGHGTVGFENRCVRKDGSVRHVSWSATPLPDERVMYCIGRDITERIRAEEAVRENEEKFRSLVEQSPISIQIFNRDGRITESNQAFMDLWGITEDALPEVLRMYNILEDEQARKLGLMPLIEKCFGGEVVVLPVTEYDSAVTTQDFGVAGPHANKRWIHGRLYPVKNSHDEVVSVVLLEDDVTERKLADDALAASEERFRATFEQAAVGIAHVAPYGRFLRINQKFCDLVGYSQEELLERTFQAITHPDDLDADVEQLNRLLCGEIKTYSMEKRYICNDGSPLWVNLTVSVVRNKAGAPRWFVSVVEDISRRKQAEEGILQHRLRLKELAFQLAITEERERRRIAEELHDQIGQSLALTRLQLSSVRKGITDRVQAESLDGVSTTLLQVAQDTRRLIFNLSSPTLSELGLAPAIAEWLEEEIGRRHGLKVDFDTVGQAKDLDEDVQRLLFRNVRELLTNVAKHSYATRVSVRLVYSAGRCEISVQDDGVGFDTEKTDSTQELTGGFGLFSIRERMADLGGSLEVHSSKGKGCTAVIAVPVQ